MNLRYACINVRGWKFLLMFKWIQQISMQTVDASDSRCKKDAKDITKLRDWFSSHDPFPKINKIVSIASGVVGDDKINCRKAHEVGIASMSRITGETFKKIKIKRSEKVLPLLAASSTIKVHEEEVAIDPVLLFQRMRITKAFEGEIENFLKYKLARYTYITIRCNWNA